MVMWKRNEMSMAYKAKQSTLPCLPPPPPPPRHHNRGFLKGCLAALCCCFFFEECCCCIWKKGLLTLIFITCIKFYSLISILYDTDTPVGSECICTHFSIHMINAYLIPFCYICVLWSEEVWEVTWCFFIVKIYVMIDCLAHSLISLCYICVLCP